MHPNIEASSKACVSRNAILARLPGEELARLAADAELVEVPAHTVVLDASEEVTHIHFICQGLASAFALMRDGRTAEAITVGTEGFIGFPALIDGPRSLFRVMALVDIKALRVPMQTVRAEVRRGGVLTDLVNRYLHMRVRQLSQLVACNGLHTVEERLARWLLHASDTLGSVRLPFTQERIADMLGAQRTTVTAAARKLELAGAIAYKRGQIDITDRSKLLESVCECYEELRGQREMIRAEPDAG
ncbi:MAG TPA: Crp/Fnr family transcriptional regulator [Clostridia bacterium]|nr:Crp/Fnr family transcriptional regulator [Clostridia bacterium]